MSKTYEVTGQDHCDAITYEVNASSKKEAISQARKMAARQSIFSRMNAPVRWSATEGE